MDICDAASAVYIRANGTATAHSNQIGILNSFGSNVGTNNRQRLLALSSGVARSASQSGACGTVSCLASGTGVPPNGFPQDIMACPSSNDIYGDIRLEITLIAPDNASGFTFDYIFFTFDYPEFVCTVFNDQFVVIMDSNPMGSINGNIAFDSDDVPIGVNVNFINLGLSSLLQLTGFDPWGDAATTGWIRTSSPVSPGQQFTLRFLIWDAGDQTSDSIVLLDDFRWISNTTTVSSTSI